jgi:hypothetical protein
MPGSITFSSKGGALVSAAPADLEIPQVQQTVTAGQRVAVIGVINGHAPAEQVIAINSTSAVTLAAPAFNSQAPLKDGQRVTLVNMGSFPITIPLNGFNTGSQAETLESHQMIQAVFKVPIGWIPCDDDAGVKMPLMLANLDAITDGPSQRMLVTDSGTRVKNGNLTAPIARLQTTSFAAKSRRVGSGTNIGYEDFTVILDDGQPGTFILPDPKACVDRCLNLVALRSVISLSIVGGTKARAGNADYLQIPAGGAAILQAVGDSTFAQWFRVGGF